METVEKKPEVKIEAIQEENCDATSKTSSSLSSQTFKKSKDVFYKADSVVCSSYVHLKLLKHFSDNLPTVFKPEELRQALMPTLESLYRQDPESLPFRQPVDPMLLGIPVYCFTVLCFQFHRTPKIVIHCFYFWVIRITLTL